MTRGSYILIILLLSFFWGYREYSFSCDKEQMNKSIEMLALVFETKKELNDATELVCSLQIKVDSLVNLQNIDSNRLKSPGVNYVSNNYYKTVYLSKTNNLSDTTIVADSLIVSDSLFQFDNDIGDVKNCFSSPEINSKLLIKTNQ